MGVKGEGGGGEERRGKRSKEEKETVKSFVFLLDLCMIMRQMFFKSTVHMTSVHLQHCLNTCWCFQVMFLLTTVCIMSLE